ncbi:MAG: alpha/beta hydrolase [Acidimicrobiia bacterium]
MRFVLVHGAYHGAWCWDRLVPELERLGHEALALDLPIGDPANGASEYAAVVDEVVAGRESVVVGHSMMGLAIPLVSVARHLVFLCAYVPNPGESFNQQRARDRIEPEFELTTSEFVDQGDGVWMIGPNTAKELFYHDATEEEADWAVARLRPQAYKIMNEVTPLTDWPDIRYTSIICRDDHAVNPVWARRVTKERLGVEVIEIDGGHSPFLTRPKELAAILDEAAV